MLGLLVGCSSMRGASSEPPTAVADASFASIQPILSARCVSCHAGSKAADGLDLSSYEGLMKGKSDGPVVVAGKPDQSLIIAAIRGEKGVKRMPLRGSPLDEAQIQAFERFVAEGAKEK